MRNLIIKTAKRIKLLAQRTIALGLLVALLLQATAFSASALVSEVKPLLNGSSGKGDVLNGIGRFESDEVIAQLKKDFLGSINKDLISKIDDYQLKGDADVIITDVWASMGQEQEKAIREKAFAGYQVNDELMALAHPDCMVQHCLPAHRGEEITAEVFEAHAQEIFDEAENRLHAQKAVMYLLMKGEEA